MSVNFHVARDILFSGHWVISVPRISMKLTCKLVTGTYILQTNRARFNQNQVNTVCLLCHRKNETVEHFLLHCPALASLRNHSIDTLLSVCDGVYSPTNSPYSVLQLILDYSALTSFTNVSNNEHLQSVEFHCRRLSHTHHCEIRVAVSRTKAAEEKETINCYIND